MFQDPLGTIEMAQHIQRLERVVRRQNEVEAQLYALLENLAFTLNRAEDINDVRNAGAALSAGIRFMEEKEAQ